MLSKYSLYVNYYNNTFPLNFESIRRNSFTVFKKSPVNLTFQNMDFFSQPAFNNKSPYLYVFLSKKNRYTYLPM